MKATEIITDAFGGTLVTMFYDKINTDLYQIARISKNWDFDTTTDELTLLDNALYDFMKKNEVPSCRVSIYKEDEYHFGIKINESPWKEFDWEVSDEVAKAHADDYEISKDEMYYDDYDFEEESDEPFDSSKYMVTDADY